MVLGMFVLVIFCSSIGMSTVSKALDMSKTIMIVLFGGYLLLNPFVMIALSSCSAVIVECCFLNPCCLCCL